MTDRRIHLLDALGAQITLTFTTTSLDIDKSPKRDTAGHTHVLHHNVLNAKYNAESKILGVQYVLKKKAKKYSHLVAVEGKVRDSDEPNAWSWVDGLMKAVYDDAFIKRRRKLLVLVNPFGGTKKGAVVYTRKVEPLLQAAECEYKTIYTTHKGHALEIAQKVELGWDAVVTVSGDGLVHEVINGFAQHADPLSALAIPVAPIPTGSGNGLALNLLGLKDGVDVGIATLNAIKGQPMPVDLFSVTQGSKRFLSFMSQSLGLMADLDLGTEHLRWMGDHRFMYGLLRGVVQFKACPVELSFKLAEKDKDRMAESLHLRTLSPSSTPLSPSAPMLSRRLPPLRFQDDGEGWSTFSEPLIYVYAGKGPYVSRTMMAFPVSMPDDGLIDITVMPKSSRGDILSCIDGAQEGKFFWDSKLEYMKAHAYRVKPLSSKGYLSIDGEPFPFEEFYVEVHQGLGSFLSPLGNYVAPFTPRSGLLSPKGAD